MANTYYQNVNGKAEHLVYLDHKAKELDKLLAGTKTAIIRGAAGKKSPLGGRVKLGDELFFVQTGGNFMVTHKAIVKHVHETDKMTEEESKRFVDEHQHQLELAKHQYERWVGKKYLCLIEVEHIVSITPFEYDRQSNMDDWVITTDINTLKKI
jgi:polyhydroxyalkanoate synthesis regulator phasin